MSKAYTFHQMAKYSQVVATTRQFGYGMLPPENTSKRLKEITLGSKACSFHLMVKCLQVNPLGNDVLLWSTRTGELLKKTSRTFFFIWQ